MCTIACLDHAQCKSYTFQETENTVKSCELSSSNANASSADLVSRQGYSYFDAEVILHLTALYKLLPISNFYLYLTVIGLRPVKTKPTSCKIVGPTCSVGRCWTKISSKFKLKPTSSNISQHHPT